MNVQLEKHFGIYVQTNVETDRARRKECLCLNCAIMTSCPVAKQLLQICVQNDCALMITRCKSFVNKNT